MFYLKSDTKFILDDVGPLIIITRDRGFISLADIDEFESIFLTDLFDSSYCRL